MTRDLKWRGPDCGDSGQGDVLMEKRRDLVFLVRVKSGGEEISRLRLAVVAPRVGLRETLGDSGWLGEPVVAP